MNEVAKYAEEIIVMNDGNIIEQVTPKELFRQGSKLEEWHIAYQILFSYNVILKLNMVSNLRQSHLLRRNL